MQMTVLVDAIVHVDTDELVILGKDEAKTARAASSQGSITNAVIRNRCNRFYKPPYGDEGSR